MNPSRTVLLTPGPLTTTDTVKQAMLRDWGSRDTGFIAITQRIRQRLVELACGQETHVCVPLQGSGTFSVEAAVGTLVPRSGKLLVLINGAYGKRIAKICEYAGRAYLAQEWPEHLPVDPATVERLLQANPDLTHIAVIHCETTSGLLNPVREIAALAQRYGKGLLIDSMSAFGAIPFDLRETPCEALISSSNKNLEGVPGFGYSIVRKESLLAAKGNCHSLSLDLYEQYQGLEKNGQWRFTPPTHVLSAFDQALTEHQAEGGVPARFARYRRNCQVLVEGMRALGFSTFLPDELQAPIIVTFLSPEDPRFDFQRLYTQLGQRGFVIYPGKLTEAPSFRIGCIGQVFEEDMRRAVAAIAEITAAMGVHHFSPAGV